MFSLCNTFSGLNSRTLQRATYFSFNHQRRKHLDRAGGGTKNTGVPFPFKATKEVKEVRIPVPWGHIAGKWWGPFETQPVLALHGWHDNAGSFDPLLPLLVSPTTSVLAIDLVGHGHSSRFPVGHCYHYIDQVINIRRIAMHYGWHEKITLLGHGTGSSLAFTYAGYYPNEVAAFVSIDGTRGSVRADDSTLAEDIGTLIDEYMATEKVVPMKMPHNYDEILLADVRDRCRYLSPDLCKTLLERDRAKNLPDDFGIGKDVRLKFDAVSHNKADFIYAIAERILCDVLNIRASRGVTMGGFRETVYLKTLEIMGNGAKSFEHREIEGPHHVHMTDPTTVAEFINQFLASKCDNLQL